jgi:hypothetical protein
MSKVSPLFISFLFLSNLEHIINVFLVIDKNRKDIKRGDTFDI